MCTDEHVIDVNEDGAVSLVLKVHQLCWSRARKIALEYSVFCTRCIICYHMSPIIIVYHFGFCTPFVCNLLLCMFINAD